MRIQAPTPTARVAQIFNLLYRRFATRLGEASGAAWVGKASAAPGFRCYKQAARAFSLLEMMVAVTLLLVIISALLTMFYQTQRAVRLSKAQVDVLEGGLATMEIIPAELSELAPSHQPGLLNLYAETNPIPFLIQSSPISTATRANILQH